MCLLTLELGYLLNEMNEREITQQSISIYKEKLHLTYLNIFGHRNYNRFAVIGHSRTGSNYLFVGLNSSSCVRMYHEVFAKRNREVVGKEFDLIFPMVFQKESRNIKAVGFKLFYDHLTRGEWEKFLSHKYIRIIHLTRENRLRTIVSLDIAYKTDHWSASANDKDKQIVEKRIVLDTSKLIDRLEQIQDYETFIRDRFKDRHILEVVYERLTTKPGEIFQYIGGYLGIDDIDLNKITLKKQNPESLEQLIVNYDEVYELLKNTKYAPHLNCHI
jgi:LPS sulfotransferase NodH